MVEDEEFKKFVQMLNGGYNLPARKTVSNSMIPNLYHQTYEKVQDLMANCFAVCLTTDGWTSIKNESFMGITAHFINEDVSLLSVCLGCEKFEERHTIENLAMFLKNTIQEWKIENKITAVVSDNAPNIVGAIRHCHFRHVSCFAHNINLVVQHALKNISPVQKKVKSIVEYFNRSTYAEKKLKETQQQMHLPALKLKQDVVTRWNSTHEMFKRILQIKDAVISTMAILQCDPDEQLTAAEWQILECSSNILQIFSEVTNEVSSELYVSMSKTLIFVRVMINTMENFKNNSALPNESQQLVVTLLEKLNSRFAGYEDNEVVTQSALLDPRFKKLSFNGYSPRKLQIAIEQLKQKVCQVTIAETETNMTQSRAPTNAENSQSLLWKTFDEQYSVSTVINPTAAGIIEVDKYLQEPLLNRHEDPLSWWRNHKLLYPRLFILVKKRLCVPATSVPCERLFSKAGMVITERRNRMLPSKSSQVIFLNHNL
jgi:zinc finger BED domain-containing protein 1 (E3 SUMO-protein ligase ZBED1)